MGTKLGKISLVEVLELEVNGFVIWKNEQRSFYLQR